jgi:hypothetical protein
MAREHLLPIGEPNPPEKDDNEEAPECKELGMEEMLAMAPEEGSMDSMNMFIKGVMPDGQTLVKLDPTCDRFPLMSHEFFLSLDIDSIIWVTYLLRVLTEILVHVLPYSGARPPIWKNNHVYVEVLMPQSKMDKEMGGRREWFSN